MTRDEALKKIKKCLALGRSASEHEAAAAVRQAQKLMEQFGLREQDVSLSDVTEVRVKACSTAANVWELCLVNMIADAFGCEQFASLRGQYNAAGNYIRTRHYVFVGLDASPTVAGYAYEVLARQCAKARLAHIAKQPRNCKAITKTARGDAFAKGWVMAAQELVERFAQPARNQTLLLTYMEVHHPDLTSAKPRDTSKARKTDLGHFAAGMDAGVRAELHRGVGGVPARELLT